VATDADGDIMREIEMTPANINNGKIRAAVLPENRAHSHASVTRSALG
jgi:hypothetical protein